MATAPSSGTSSSTGTSGSSTPTPKEVLANGEVKTAGDALEDLLYQIEDYAPTVSSKFTNFNFTLISS